MAGKKLVAIMRTGTFKDSAGNPHTFDVAKLDAIAAAYNPQFHEAPEVIGHPKTDDPAWGWVKSLKRDGDILFYEPGDRVPEFQQMIDLRMFKNRSVKLGADGVTIKHVGWLGAQAPAVKGLPVAFSEDSDSIDIEFAEPDDPGVIEKMKKMLMEMMDMVSGKDKKKETMPEKDGMQMNEKEEENMGEIDDLKKQITESSSRIAEFSEKEQKKDADILALRKQLKEKEAAERKKDFAQFCEGLQKEGKLPPAVVPTVVEFMEILSGTETFEFSEGEGKVKVAPVERFKTLLGSLKKVIEFSEVATKDKGAKNSEGSAEERLDTIARGKMAAKKELSYSAAFSEAQIENKELAVEYAAEVRGE